MHRSLQLLGMAKKAGLLAVGSEAVSTATRHRKARLVISASDASPGSIRRACVNAETGGAIYIDVPFTKFELGSISGRGSPGAVAFLDAGLAAGFVKRLADTNPGHYEEILTTLENETVKKAERSKKTPARLKPVRSPVKRVRIGEDEQRSGADVHRKEDAAKRSLGGRNEHNV
jgi:ribosomal protein L7Ae-like RNA K-turn-binding protein